MAAPAPSPGAVAEVRRLAGPAAEIASVASLVGGQHAATWRLATTSPERTFGVREFPARDPAAAADVRVLKYLAGLGGLSPRPLSWDLDARWSAGPTVITSWLDGTADITPADPRRWARELGRALAAVHAFPGESLPSVFTGRGGSPDRLAGPAAKVVRSRWSELLTAPEVLIHQDFWSGNVVWRDGRLTGIVDWSGAGRGPRGVDLGWCRLDLFLLFDEAVADYFLAAYGAASGERVELGLWDAWAVARSHDGVASWTPNYAPLGRPDLTPDALRERHRAWTSRVLTRDFGSRAPG